MEDRTTVRLAQRIREALLAQARQRLAQRCAPDWRISELMEQYTRLCRRAGKAQSRGWRSAAEHDISGTHRVLMEMLVHIQHITQSWSATAPLSPTLGDLVRELQQIEAEFGAYEFSTDDQRLSVRTERIVLEGIDLGPFGIVLNCKADSREAFTYSVEALDANSAEGRDDVTHPHINGEKLCAGDALHPIDAALDEGRLCDFFLLVRSVLHTYNSGSAYVRLEDWSGEPCHDCGYLMGDGEGFYCDVCDRNFCESCVSTCHICDTVACSSCMGTCTACERATCTSCLKDCRECGDACCPECLEEGVCLACRLSKENTHEESIEPAPAATA